MPRYIMIESNSGYVWADTADLDGPARDETPAEACKRMEEVIDNGFPQHCSYEAHGPGYNPNGANAYFVYQPAEDFPLVDDGSLPDSIEAVEENCKLIAVVTVRDDIATQDEWILTRHIPTSGN